MSTLDPPEIVELGSDETHALRRRVLRDGTPNDAVEFDGDDLPDTFHLGVRCGGVTVAVSTWVPRRYPDLPASVAFQLRGMATAPDHRRRGYGSQLLVAGIARASAAGAELVWARARDSALAFYSRHGFVTTGPGYLDLTTQLPHHDIVLRLG